MLFLLAVGWVSDGVVGGVNSLAFVDITWQSASDSGCDFRAAISCSSVRVGGGELMFGGLSSSVEVPREDGIVVCSWGCLECENLMGCSRDRVARRRFSCYLRNVNDGLRENGKRVRRGLRNKSYDELDEAGKRDE